MNTLTLIKKQIQKANALHDAQIAMTSYRGVKYECKQGAEEIHGTFCYRGHTYNKWWIIDITLMIWMPVTDHHRVINSNIEV